MIKKIKAENKRQWKKLISEHRGNGYFIITYGHTLAELEKGDELVVIEY